MSLAIPRIPVCQKDVLSLQSARERTVVKNRQPEDYRGKVVIKPWGYEFLIFENEFVAVWFLHIRKDHSTSMHCHPRKKTSLTLLSGEALVNSFRHRKHLSAGDTLMTEAGVFHATKSLSTKGIYLIEVESPPDKTDLVRFEDSYGREERGYEGYSQMVMENLEDFDFFCFDGENGHKMTHALRNGPEVSMETYVSASDFQENFSRDPSSTYCVCKGIMWSGDGSIYVEAGESELGKILKDADGLTIDGPIALMKFRVRD